MKRKLRIISLIMLVAGVLFVIAAFMCMDVPIDPPLPLSVMKVIYKIYPVITVALFVISFFINDDDNKQ